MTHKPINYHALTRWLNICLNRLPPTAINTCAQALYQPASNIYRLLAPHAAPNLSLALDIARWLLNEYPNFPPAPFPILGPPRLIDMRRDHYAVMLYNLKIEAADPRTRTPALEAEIRRVEHIMAELAALDPLDTGPLP